MPDLNGFDKRDKKFLEAIKEIVFELLHKSHKLLSKKLDYVSKKLDHVYKSLRNKNVIEPFIVSSSPKKITKKSYKLLKDNNVKESTIVF